MTRTEKLLAELIALPSVNSAFAPQDGATARQARLSKFGEKNVADFLASIAKRAGLEVEFQRVFGVRGHVRALKGGDVSPHSQIERSNLIIRLRPRNKVRQISCLRPTSTPSAPMMRNLFRAVKMVAFTVAAPATQKVPWPRCSPCFANWQT